METQTERKNTALLEVKAQVGRIPLVRRREFIYGYLALVVVFGTLLLPKDQNLAIIHYVIIAVFSLLCVGLTALIVTDTYKPEWLKTAAVFLLLIVLGALYYAYSAAQWDRMIFLFFNVNIIQKAWSTLVTGIWVTIQLAFFSALLSTTLGLLLAVFRSFNNWVLNVFIIAYIDFFRSMPILVLMVLVYYALPYLGIKLDAMVAGILALGLNSSAYVSEIFRAGILSVKRGQIEAAKALGLNPIQTMRLILLPQAFRVVLPPLVGNYVASAKDTAICSSISIIELLKAGLSEQALLANPSPLIFSAVLYLIMFIPLTRLSGLLEKRMKASVRKINV